MFWQHYLENKKPSFFACNPEHVLEFSKNKDLFSEPPNLLSPNS